MGEVGAGYKGLRTRVTELVTVADPAALESIAPATPEWRVRDVLAHLVGVTADVLAGNIEGAATDPWTAAQVDARRSLPVSDLLAEWEAAGPAFDTMLDELPFELVGQAMFDAATHEHDVRNALGRPGARDSDAVAFAWQWFVLARPRGGAPTLQFVTETGEETSGAGDPVARIEAPRFELVRAVTGRRTAAEISAFGWDIEPKPELMLAASFFTLPTESLNE